MNLNIFVDNFKKFEWKDNYTHMLAEINELTKEISLGKWENNDKKINDELLDTIQSAISVLESHKKVGLLTFEDEKKWQEKLKLRLKKYNCENNCETAEEILANMPQQNFFISFAAYKKSSVEFGNVFLEIKSVPIQQRLIEKTIKDKTGYDKIVLLHYVKAEDIETEIIHKIAEKIK